MSAERPLADRRVMVTGASRGIGRGIAETMVGHGARVLACARSLSDLQSLQAACEPLPGELTFCTCDLTDSDSIDQLLAQARQTFEHLDLLVNNAGMGIFATVPETTLTDWDQVMAVNARGTFYLSRQAFTWMQNGGGQIINISSVVGVKGYERQIAYSAAKHAVMGITKVLAREGQPYGIRCNAICPGGVATEMVAQARPDLDPAALIQVADVVRAVVYLATEPDSCVTDMIALRRTGSLPFP